MIPLLALALAGCGLGGPPAASTGGPAVTPTPAASSASPTSSSAVSTSASLSPLAGPSATVPASAPPEASGSPAAACFGKPAQQQFFSAIAAAVTWDVYCAVLPAGWSVEGGTYHLAAGGRMEISYLGPNGARFELQEGSFCTGGASACEPHDQVLGTAAFGDRQGELVTLGPGLALYVDPGAAAMWQAAGTALSRATFVQLCAALAKVAD